MAKKKIITDDPEMDKVENSKVDYDMQPIPLDPDVTKRFRIQFDIGYKGTPGKEVDSESQTVPDMTLTVRQLLINHSRGIDSGVQHRQPLYFETEIPTLEDITDVERFQEQLENRLAETKAFLAKEKQLEKDLFDGKPPKPAGTQLDLEEESKKAE